MSSYNIPLSNQANISFKKYFIPTGEKANIHFGDPNLIILAESFFQPNTFGNPLVTGPELLFHSVSILSSEFFGNLELSQTNTFVISESIQVHIVSPGHYLVKCWGASGKEGFYGDSYTSRIPALGGYAEGIIELTEETVIYVFVGGGTVKEESLSTLFKGGWNGGGDGDLFASNALGGGGGGASDIRIGGTSLYDRVIVAGGGGGIAFADFQNGGAGGGLEGVSSGSPYSTGGTQTAPGNYGASFGIGGSTTFRGSGGGGGGWFGGGASSGLDYQLESGSGGSSYIGGELLIDGNQFPKIPVIDGYTATGVNFGHGLVQIFPVSMDPELIITDIPSILSQESISNPSVLYSGLGFSKINSEKILLRKGYVKVNGVLKPLTMGYEKKDGILRRLF